MSDKLERPNRYAQIIEKIFRSHFHPGDRSVTFERHEIEQVAQELNIQLPKNLGDLLYTFRYRSTLPAFIQGSAPEGKEWIILPAGRSKYRFTLTPRAVITPSEHLAETKVLDATPGMIEKYALTDEQALLAKLRYNRLVDVFTGVTCYSLQSHLRTFVPDMGQVETDEVYIGLDKRGAHYVFPVQAKGGRDKISIVQIAQDFALCQAKFPSLICRPIAAQFMKGELIALFYFEQNEEGISISSERHYRLVATDSLSSEDIELYRSRPETI